MSRNGPVDDPELATLSVTLWSHPSDLFDVIGPNLAAHPYLFDVWLPIIGPTSTTTLVLLNRVVYERGCGDEPVLVEPGELAAMAGCGMTARQPGPGSLIGRSLRRLVGFDFARWDEASGGLAVRSRLAPVPARFAHRLPRRAWQIHERETGVAWQEREVTS